MIKTIDEYDLLCRLATGDRNAFDAVYRQYYQAVFRNSIKITRDTIAAEDVVQEVFITLWEKRETIHCEQSIGGWLFVLCYNKSVNVLRKKLRESLAYKHIAVVADDSSVDEFNYALQWQLLENATALLSPQKRKVFELCKLQGKTYEETASTLQISKYTVKEYLSASVSFVKEYMHQHAHSSATIQTGLLMFIALDC